MSHITDLDIAIQSVFDYAQDGIELDYDICDYIYKTLKDKSDLDELLQKVADHYKYEEQQWTLIEEMSEVAKEINKFRKKKYSKQSNAYKKLISELADLSVILPQVIYLLSCEERVARIAQEKIHRQINRMEKETEVQQECTY